ncbi:MAG: glycosyltransferase [Flavobacteriales bacterium]|nr:glycosyltransferase [Flavobacteriales bacterium]
MRILLVAAASSVHVMRWANAFAERGLHVHLASLHDPVPGFLEGVTLHRMPHLGGLGYLINRPFLRRLIRTLRPDVINAHYASGYGTLAVRQAGTPLVLNVWGSDVYEFPDAGPLHRWLLRRNLLRADTVVSTSEVMAARTKRICPELKEVVVVPFGVDTERFHPRTALHEDVVIGTVKTLAPKYGIDTLLRAFEILTRSSGVERLRLRIVGGGPQRAELERIAVDLGIKELVEFTGPVPHDQVPDELRRLDVYAALSRADSESFGVAVIEASACGLPVVVTGVGGLPEVVEQDVTGSIVPPDDPRAAAAALEQLIASPALRERMGLAGRDRVMRRYAWSTCVDSQLAVFERVINRAKR